MKKGAWEEAIELEAERLRILQEEDAVDPEQDLQENIGVLREIKALNSEMESVCQQGKSMLSSQLRQIRQGQKAGKAYHQNRRT